jgi:hypothetical protein
MTAYTTRNPDYAGQYANVPEYGAPNSAYSAPSIHEPNAYNDEFGWAFPLENGLDGTPDDMRLGSQPSRDVRPHPSHPRKHYAAIDTDDQHRHTAEDQDADGWAKQGGHYRVGIDPRWNPPAEERATSQLSPRSYSFTRPYDQLSKGNGARQFNGVHFSMADHRREYPILGMKPATARRNTYRIDPAPWDHDYYDIPPESTVGTTTQARVQTYEIPPSIATRSYRLQ